MEDMGTDTDKNVERLYKFAKSMAEGPCWSNRSADPARDCPYRSKKTRYSDWCRRCEAKYWALEDIAAGEPT